MGITFGQNTGVQDIVMQAMSDELERSMAELRLKELEKPYFIQYVVLDEEMWSAEAVFGALTSSEQSRRRVLQAQVRVGDYDMDNSDFAVGRGVPSTGTLAQTVVDDDYDVLRRALWLATDASYKQSVEVFARKRAFLQNRIQNDEEIPDFSREDPVRYLGARETLNFDKTAIEQQIRDWSRILKDSQDLQSSSVRFEARLVNRYLANSEGSRILQPSLLLSVEAEASTQAEDGMVIRHSVPIYARSFEQLPSVREIGRTIRQLAADLSALRSAPVLEEHYSGPVLLAGRASADFFARVLAPSLSGERGVLWVHPQPTIQTSELLDRMNRPVLPARVSAYDDPGLRRFGDHALVGYYLIDDQGVPGRRVSLIEDGLLIGLLMGRKPARGFPLSNGHGRSGYPGREAPQISNLVISNSKGMHYEDLKRELIRLCRTERLKYGILIKMLDRGAPGSIGQPIITYKVYVADGREELVRGVETSGFSVRSLRHIQATGSEMYVSNRLAGARGAQTPVSVVAPAVVLEEMELKRAGGSQQRPALLTPPEFSRPKTQLDPGAKPGWFEVR